jgi:PEP-CTERM putative exosortase interaction domain
VSFSEDFSSNTAGPNLGLKGGSSANIDFSAGNARFTGTNPLGAERAYIGTSTNFNLAQDFTVEVQVTVPSAGGGNGVALFGFGSGTPGDSSAGGGPSYYEPSAGPAAYVALIPDDFGNPGSNSKISYADFNAANTGGTAATFYASGGNDVILGSGTHRVRMSYNASTTTLTFSYQEDSIGSFINLGPSINIGDNGFNSTTGQIFMGGAGGVTYDNVNVTVIPEPSHLAMLAFVSAGTLLRRTRRS